MEKEQIQEKRQNNSCNKTFIHYSPQKATREYEEIISGSCRSHDCKYMKRSSLDKKSKGDNISI